MVLSTRIPSLRLIFFNSWQDPRFTAISTYDISWIQRKKLCRPEKNCDWRKGVQKGMFKEVGLPSACTIGKSFENLFTECKFCNLPLTSCLTKLKKTLILLINFVQLIKVPSSINSRNEKVHNYLIIVYWSREIWTNVETCWCEI